MYTKSKLRSIFGCESRLYADYLREQLRGFREANVKCYFIFRGGSETRDKLLETDENEGMSSGKNRVYEPLFARDVYKEVLNDMDMDYAICEYANKRDCVALGQRLHCPVLAFDIEYFFFGTEYVPYPSLQFNPTTKVMQCKLLLLDMLMEKFQLCERDIAVYITLFDDNVFSEEFREKLLRKLRLPLSYGRRHETFLRWLSRNGGSALEIISKLVSRNEDRTIRLELERKIKNLKVRESGGLPTKYFLDRDCCVINRGDREWFSKGLIWRFVAIPYVNVYRHGIVTGSWSTEDNDAEDAMLLSAPIVRYALDLLTNYNDAELLFVGAKRNPNVDDENPPARAKDLLKIATTIRKPEYGSSNVFENGWSGVSKYRLFEHFLAESVQMNTSVLEQVPAECRMLVVALVYFARQKGSDVDNEAYSVLLSYAVLTVADGGAGVDEPLKDGQCEHARALMDEYSNISDEEVELILDRKSLHPLVEFQHCLRHLNFLNTLCGSTLAPTVYSKTYSATFVYKILRDMKRYYNGNGRRFLEDKLDRASSVLSIVNKLYNLYSDMKLKKV
ncbi:unnamed protein product, partial [Iphiclides podalirius]